LARKAIRKQPTAAATQVAANTAPNGILASARIEGLTKMM
jgi:hypothetical protein